MKSFIKYPGGKSKELPLVEKYKPEQIERYFEPFLGGGSIFFGLEEKENYINDFSKDLITIYKLIKDRNYSFFNSLKFLNELWHKIENDKIDKEIFGTYFDYKKFNQYYKKTEFNKKLKLKRIEETNNIKISKKDKISVKTTSKKTALYMLVRDRYNLYINDIFHFACFYFLREYCYSSMFRFSENGKFNVPYGGKSYDTKYLSDKIEYIENEVSQKLQKAEIYNLDFEKFLQKFDLNENDFIFLDPPYDSEFSTYDKNVFDKNEQKRLNEFLKRTKAKWMLIIKKTDFISELYKGFNVINYDMNYSVSFKNRNNRDVEHLLITNYEIN